MIEVQVLIPVKGNDGVSFSFAHHAAFEAELLARFGGYSLLPSEVVGAWVEGGVSYHDRTRVYAVAVKSIVDGSLVGEVVTYAKAHYAQLAIGVRYLGLFEVL